MRAHDRRHRRARRSRRRRRAARRARPARLALRAHRRPARRTSRRTASTSRCTAATRGSRTRCARIATGLERLAALVARARAAVRVRAAGPRPRDRRACGRRRGSSCRSRRGPRSACRRPGSSSLYDLADLAAADVARLVQRRAGSDRVRAREPVDATTARSRPTSRRCSTRRSSRRGARPWSSIRTRARSQRGRRRRAPGRAIAAEIAREPGPRRRRARRRRARALGGAGRASVAASRRAPRSRLWAGGPVPSNRFSVARATLRRREEDPGRRGRSGESDDPVGLPGGQWLRDHRGVVGSRGHRAVRARRARSLLVDVQLPRKNGFELVREIKSRPAGKTTPILLMSAVYTDRDQSSRTVQLGTLADGYLTKPFDLVAAARAGAPAARRSRRRSRRGGTRCAIAAFIAEMAHAGQSPEAVVRHLERATRSRSASRVLARGRPRCSI